MIARKHGGSVLQQNQIAFALRLPPHKLPRLSKNNKLIKIERKRKKELQKHYTESNYNIN